MTEQSNEQAPPPSKTDILAVITSFLKNRLGADYSEQAAQKWIADRARNAGQIKEVTHVAKYSHPDATCEVKIYAQHIRSTGNASAADFHVGTHTIDAFENLDAAGNSAEHPIYTFLQNKVGKETLLNLAYREEPALQAAFATIGDTDGEWIKQFEIGRAHV